MQFSKLPRQLLIVLDNHFLLSFPCLWNIDHGLLFYGWRHLIRLFFFFLLDLIVDNIFRLGFLCLLRGLLRLVNDLIFLFQVLVVFLTEQLLGFSCCILIFNFLCFFLISVCTVSKWDFFGSSDRLIIYLIEGITNIGFYKLVKLILLFFTLFFNHS